ncbi:hypothetical protein ACFFX0_31215 [Citricoccus parietis]|uniref:Uncharacterized protein n=1 Tax=Citricoccus parietis TaxID=592307 RepID=A0ABV5G8X2_9MICC
MSGSRSSPWSVRGPASAPASHRPWIRTPAHRPGTDRRTHRSAASERTPERYRPSRLTAVESCIRCKNPTATSTLRPESTARSIHGATPSPQLTCSDVSTPEDGSSCIYCNSRWLSADKLSYVNSTMACWRFLRIRRLGRLPHDGALEIGF